ncbi:MAG: cysteine synthase A [Candidatus Metalachnospira sp.]|nr:cysteine synthase A [Candidatus Metalachnospira sp.]
MSKILNSVLDLVGSTPIMELKNLEKQMSAEGKILAKLEYFNPAGSIKDRVAKQMIEDAEKEGKLAEGSTIIEPTSGNTGIGLASMAVAMGYKCVIIMPDTMSVERRTLIKAYGAEIVLSDGTKGMAGAIELAEEIQKKTPESIIAGQFINSSNPKAHYLTTGPEIWNDTDGEVDVFVASVGTGGTLTGTARYLKEKNPDIKVFAVEPASSPLLSEGRAGAHKIQGIGANFVPVILDTNIYDGVITVTDEDAYKTANVIAKTEGILVGISSGAAAWAACEISKQPEYKDKKIVVILPDSGDRYISAGVYE